MRFSRIIFVNTVFVIEIGCAAKALAYGVGASTHHLPIAKAAANSTTASGCVDKATVFSSAVFSTLILALAFVVISGMVCLTIFKIEEARSKLS